MKIQQKRKVDMNRSEELIAALVDENYLKTKEIVHDELYNKVGSAIDEIREDAYAAVFDEAKKAKKTDKEDDGDGLDPVGAEDSDVDNDGDSDESDDYLNNRRKTVGKAIKKKKNGDDEELDEAQHTSDKADGGGTTSKDLDLNAVRKKQRKKKVENAELKHLAREAGQTQIFARGGQGKQT